MTNTLHWLMIMLWQLRDRSTRLWLMLALICLALARIMVLVTIFIYRDLINYLLPHEKVYAIPISLLCLYGGLQLLATFFQECRDVLLHPVIRSLTSWLNLRALQSLYNENYEFHANQPTSVIVNQLQRGLSAVETIITILWCTLIPGICEIVIISGIIAWLFPIHFFIIIITGAVLYAVFMTITGYFLYPSRLKANLAQGYFQQVVTEGLMNSETVTLFNQEVKEKQRALHAQTHYQYQQQNIKRWQSLINLGKQVILVLTMVSILWISARLVILQGASLGDFIIINFLLAMVIQPIIFSGNLYHQLKQALVDLAGLRSLINQTILPKQPTFMPTPRGEIILRNIQFTYPGQHKPILNNFNLFIRAGESVAIIGESGQGKSTLIKLFLGYYSPEQGEIIVDGRQLDQMQCSALRSHCAVVSQDVQLFHQTIAENIAYGSQATLKDIQHVASLVHLHEYINNLPNGYQTMVGERGAKLSGGQRQRIAIARAILRKPSIFIFDEATSSLDRETETAIMQTIHEISRGHTTLLITHRLHLAHYVMRVVTLSEQMVVPAHSQQN